MGGGSTWTGPGWASAAGQRTRTMQFPMLSKYMRAQGKNKISYFYFFKMRYFLYSIDLIVWIITGTWLTYASSGGALHFVAANNDCGVRDFDMERFQLCKHFRYPWPVNVSFSLFRFHEKEFQSICLKFFCLYYRFLFGRKNRYKSERIRGRRWRESDLILS